MALNRRKFLVTLGNTTLGTFFLPEVAAGMSALEPIKGEYALRRITEFPEMVIRADGSFWLAWAEEIESGRTLATWTPKSPEAIAEALRFYQASRDYLTPEMLATLSRIDLPKPTGQEAELIQEILRNPTQEEPRLKYAAYLEKKGNSQGTLIRRCCERNRLPLTHPYRRRLETECQTLISEHANDWLEPLLRIRVRPQVFAQLHVEQWLGETGLIEYLDVYRPGILPDQSANLFAAAPLLRKIRISYNQADYARVLSAPELRQVVSLDVKTGPKDIPVICGSQHLSSLRELKTSGTLGHDPIHFLAQTQLYSQLEVLKVPSAKMGPRALAALLCAQQDKRPLRELNLWGNKLNALCAVWIASSDLLQELRALNLEYNSIQNEGAQAIFSSERMKHLESLNLVHTDIQDASLSWLRSASFVRSLKWLHVGSNRLTAIAAQYIAETPWRQLGKLELSLNRIGPAGAKALAASSSLTQLTDLNLSHCHIGPRGAMALSHAPFLSSIQEFTLSFNNIGDAGLIALCHSRQLKSVRRFHLSDNAIGPAGVEVLANCAELSNLFWLSLDENEIGSGGAKALANSPYLRNLKHLSLSRDSASASSLDLLRERFGADNIKLRR